MNVRICNELPNTLTPLTEPEADWLLIIYWVVIGRSLVRSNLVQFVTSGPVVAMEVMGDEAVSAWRRILGPTDAAAARKDAPGSLRARYGTDGTKNAAHGSDSLASAARVG